MPEKIKIEKWLESIDFGSSSFVPPK